MKSILVILTAILSGVSVMAQQTIDVHCHNVLPEFTEFLERHGAAMEETFPLPKWDVISHLEFMENAGIGKAILSMPAPQPTNERTKSLACSSRSERGGGRQSQPCCGNTDECSRIIRFYNEASARLKSDYPGRFLFCASLPLPDVEASIKEAVYALDTLDADGIKLATNSRGQYLGDPALDTLMSVLNERHAVVILHPHKPVPVNDTLISATPLAIYEYPAETTRTVINMITHNVPARYPNIRFVIPHCGSFVPLALPRMKMVHPAMVAKGLMNLIDWEANLRNLYYDLAGGATPDVIKSLLSITTPDHLMYGSDYPYQPAAVLTDSLNKLRTALKSDDTLAPHIDDILWGNAYKLFITSSAARTYAATEAFEFLTYSDIATSDETGQCLKLYKESSMCAKEPMAADGIVRLSKIEVHPQYLNEYMRYATEVGEISLRTGAGRADHVRCRRKGESLHGDNS